MNKPLVKKYYPVPPSKYTVEYEYQNINKDSKLREDITIFFREKILKWIIKYPEFKEITLNKNNELIYKILRKIVKKKKLNWYELRSNSPKLKKYFLKYL